MSIKGFGQDPIYSQFYMSPILVNPAFAGTTTDGTIGLNYRNQWRQINNAYSTFSLAYDRPYSENGSWGAHVTADNAGDGAMRSVLASAVYGHTVNLSRSTFLKGGLELGYGQTSLDWNKLVFLDNLDPQYGAVSPGGVRIPTAEVPRSNLSRNYLDLGGGLLIFSSQWYAGLSVKHANSPTIDFIDDATGEESKLPTRFNLQAGMQIDLLPDNIPGMYAFVSPNVIASVQNDYYQVMAGAYVNVYEFFGGLWYRQGGRNGDAVIASAGATFGVFKIGYSFDYTISDLGIGSGGTHEIGISLRFDNLESKHYKFSDCLNMFR